MNGGGFQNIPPVTKNLLIINALVLLATFTLGSTGMLNLNKYLALHFIFAPDFNPLQYFTYMFMHGDIMHLFFNMFSLWMFGATLERVWGGKKFFTYYVLTGIGAALLHTAVVYWEIMPDVSLLEAFLNDPTKSTFANLISNHKFRLESYEVEKLQYAWEAWQQNPTQAKLRANVIQLILDYKSSFLNGPKVVGASGSVYGILLAFGYLFPNMRLMLLFPPIPMKAKFFVLIFGVMELFMAIQNNPGDNVAHFAHLGGMLFGFALLKYWKQEKLQ